eukprot:1142328-Amphidinium_carterae.1
MNPSPVIAWLKVESVAHLVNRFTQSEQLAYNGGHTYGAARLGVIQTELDQARRQHYVQTSSLRNELTTAQANASGA